MDNICRMSPGKDETFRILMSEIEEGMESGEKEGWISEEDFIKYILNKSMEEE